MGYSPFYLNQGHHPRVLPTDPVTEPDTPAGKYLEELDRVTKVAKESLKKTKEAMKKRWDAKKRIDEIYEEGDQVLVQVEYLPSNRLSKKLDDKWRGPFKVLSRKGESAYKLDLLEAWKGHRTFNAQG
jgi:hypothetical protein